MYAIGCDVGSQSLKGIMLDPAGRVVAQASAVYDVRYPHPGWAEQDSLDWRRALASVVGALRERAGVPAADIGVLGLAAQVDGLVAVDADAEPLAPAIIWLDRRAAVQASSLGDAVDPVEIRRLTGLNLDASHVAPKMLWLRDTLPTTFERAAGLLLPGGALVAWLTGERVADHANASSTLLYDVTTRAWSPPMLEATGLDAARLGTIAPATEVAGTLRDGPAAALGLTTATRVVVGTGDEHGASLGAGGIHPGIVIDITGTAEPVCVAATSPIIDETGLVETHAHADPRVWLVENPGFVSGGSVAWFTGVMGDGHAAARLDAEAAAETGPGAGGVTFLPTLSGATAPRWNDRARGVYSGLSLSHGRAHLYRALLEGCAFALRDIVDRLDAMGLAGDEIRVVGGGARSPLWLQMKADVTGRTVRVMASDESTALGAAMLAGVGAGTFAGLDQAVERLSMLEPAVYAPDPATAHAYDDAYGRYRALFDAVEPGFAARAGVGAGAGAGVTERVALPDPTDLDSLRRRLADDPTGPRRPIGLGTVRIGPDALRHLADDVAAVRRDGPVVLVADETPIRRGGHDLKAEVQALLSERFATTTTVLHASNGELHADADALAQADAGIARAGCVVSVGSGTVTDVAKDASMRAGGIPFVVVQTAVSVNAFSDDMAVLLRDGVKRTVPSRWPDVLIVDLGVIADAPPAMNRAGFGELCSMFTAPADWYLASAVGLDDGYDPGVVRLFRDGAERLLQGAGRVPANEPEMLAELAGRMTLTGIAMGVAGRTAPLSGTEHLLSHLLDMAAGAAGRPLAFHGAQVGVASVVAATIWIDTLDRLDPRLLTDDRAFPAPDAVEQRVRAAFDPLDPSGRMADECWRDVGRKLERWRAARATVEVFAAGWEAHRAELRRLVTTPDTLTRALRDAGAPARIAELDPPAPEATVRWALRALPLMRDRFTVADLRFFAGGWDDATVDDLLARSGILGVPV